MKRLRYNLLFILLGFNDILFGIYHIIIGLLFRADSQGQFKSDIFKKILNELSVFIYKQFTK